MTKQMCSKCRHITLKPAGRIKASPRGGLRMVRWCPRCNYKCIDGGKKARVNGEKE